MRGNPSRRRDWPVEEADWVVERTNFIISSSGTSRPSVSYCYGMQDFHSFDFHETERV